MAAQKNIMIWLRSSQKETFSPHYHKGASYLALLDALVRRGHRAFLAYDAAGYAGNGLFHPAEEYRDGALHASVPGAAEPPVRADAVYNLGNIPREDLPGLRITNTPSFRNFFSSKFAAYELLREFFPETIHVAREEDLLPALARLPAGELAAFKPDAGTNGRGVRIIKKDEVAPDGEMRAIVAEPGGALLQEFIDTKAGITGVCDSYHDLRLAVMNGGAIALAHVRTPKAGSLIANHAQGAAIREVAPADIPQSVLALHRAVHAKIAARFPNPTYTMDAGIGADGRPLLFEINGTTAFPWPEFAGKEFFIENLADHLEKIAE